MTTNYVKEITLDLSAESYIQYVDAKQGDNASRFLRIHLTADGQPYTIGAGELPMLRVRKPDGRSVIAATSVEASGTVLAELSDQALAVPGEASADLTITDDSGGALSTATFYLRVHRAALGENLKSQNDFGEFLAAALAVKQAAKDIGAEVARAENAAKRAEKAASEVRDGDDGITPHIGDNGNWFLGETDTGKPSKGETGPAGKTPVKGTDYCTEADKDELVAAVLAALPAWEGGSY